MNAMEIVTASQLAAKLQVTRRTVYRLIRENRIPRKKVGGQWRFDLMDVLKSLDTDLTLRNPVSSDPKTDGTPAGA